jgi:hypothetical protein
VTNVPRMLTLRATDLCVSLTTILQRIFQFCLKEISECKEVLYSTLFEGFFLFLCKILQVT